MLFISLYVKKPHDHFVALCMSKNLQWLADALICNGGGIYFGMRTLDYLSMKPYHWRGMWNIPTYR